jgi:hypothetical protein
MGKQRRRAERGARRKLRLIQGGGEGGPAAPNPNAVPLEGRPEYEAHMAAWRKHGCPRPT